MTPESYIAQKTFDEKYITSREVCERLKVTRPALHNRRKVGKLPNPIVTFNGQLVMWEREFITAYLDEWETQIKASRGEVQ